MRKNFAHNYVANGNPVVIIPARLNSTRLPNKPLADICGLPMIVQVLNQAKAANCGPVIVACADKEIFSTVESAGGKAVMTSSNHQSGSDRIFEALEIIDPNCSHKIVINIQGDLPTLSPELPQIALDLLLDPDVDIGTLASPIISSTERKDPNVVKAIVSKKFNEHKGRALYFTRTDAPYGKGKSWHHIGLYTYRREVLKRFVSLPQSELEKREKLEQLRALEDGMRIDIGFVDTFPIGVDTPDDLKRARAEIAGQNQ